MISEEQYQSYITELEAIKNITLWHPKFEDILNDSTHRLMFESLIFNSLKSIFTTVTSDTWKLLRKDFIEYLSLRELQTTNPLLKSRYASIKAICFKKDVGSAYDVNVSFFSVLIRSTIDFPTFKESFYALVKTYVITKESNNKSLYQLLASYLNDKDILSDNKCILVDSILSCDISGFKITQIPDFYSICEPLLDKITEKTRRKHLLTNLIIVCEKLKNLDTTYSIKEKRLYEILADNELQFLLEEDPNNAMIPHLNHSILQNVITWYKESGNLIKKNDAEQRLIRLKNTRVFPSFTNKIYTKEQEAVLNSYFNTVQHFNTSTYLSGLANNFFGIFPSHSHIFNEASHLSTTSDFEIVKVDACGNETKVKEEDIPTYNYFCCYDQFFQPVIQHFSEQILDKLFDGTLTYQKVKNTLIQETFLGKPFDTMLGFRQSLYDFIENPLKILFYELRKVVKNKPYNLSNPIELLCLKIERILREILYIRGISTITTSPDKEQFILFNKILDHLEENNTYNSDDINYLKFILSNEGYNLRNFTAHGFIDRRYNRTVIGIYSCIALFVAILKIGYKINSSPN